MKRLSVFLALILLCLPLCACADAKKPMNYKDLYLNVDTVGKSKVKSYRRASLDNSEGMAWTKEVIVRGLSYTLTAADVENIVSSDGILLSQRDLYYKAASKNGTSPKLTAKFDHDTGTLMYFTIDSPRFYEEVKGEEDLIDLYKNVLTSNWSDFEAELTVISYYHDSVESGYKSGADAYIVSSTRNKEATATGSAVLTLTTTGFRFDADLEKTDSYEDFLKGFTVEKLQQAANESLRNQTNNEDLTVNVLPESVSFTLVGGRPCILFDASTDDSSAAFSAMFFLK